MLVSTLASYNKKTILQLDCQNKEEGEKKQHRNKFGDLVKIPATDFPFLLISVNAKGVRTRTVVYCPGGSPRL